MRKRIYATTVAFHSSSFTPTAMFERIFPFAVTVGGFSITTKFSRVSLAPWTLARPVSPPDVAAAAGVSEECVLVTVPHAAHRTAVDPAAYANIDRHPSHRAYAISRPLADRRAASANKSNGSRIDPRLALAAARGFTLTVSHSAHRTCVASRGNRIITSHPSHRIDSVAVAVTVARVSVTWLHSAHRTYGLPVGYARTAPHPRSVFPPHAISLDPRPYMPRVVSRARARASPRNDARGAHARRSTSTLRASSRETTAMPTTTRRSTRRGDDDDAEEAPAPSARRPRETARASDSDDDAPPEEVSGAAGRASARRARESERDARVRVKETAKALKRKRAAAENERRAVEARERVGREEGEDVGGAKEDEEDDELEALPQDVIDAVLRKKSSDGDGESAYDAYEAHIGEKRREKKGKKSKKAKRRVHERDGFEVVALDADEDDANRARPASALDFMKGRLMDKHARSGEMLRDVRTGRIPNAFARR